MPRFDGHAGSSSAASARLRPAATSRSNGSAVREASRTRSHGRQLRRLDPRLSSRRGCRPSRRRAASRRGGAWSTRRRIARRRSEWRGRGARGRERLVTAELPRARDGVRCFGASVVRLRAGLRWGRRLDGCLPERLTGASGRWDHSMTHEDQGERREVHADHGAADAKPVFEDRQPGDDRGQVRRDRVTAITATARSASVPTALNTPSDGRYSRQDHRRLAQRFEGGREVAQGAGSSTIR